MEKEFVPYELAVKLKELGFDEPCLAFWDAYNGGTHLLFKQRIEYHWLLRLFGKKPEPVLEISNGEIEYLEGDGAILAPTFSQAFRWFREKYQLYCGILTEYSYGGQLCAYNITGKHQGDISIGGFNTYEEAELECLIKLIEIVKNK